MERTALLRVMHSVAMVFGAGREVGKPSAGKWKIPLHPICSNTKKAASFFGSQCPLGLLVSNHAHRGRASMIHAQLSGKGGGAQDFQHTCLFRC